MIGAAFLRTVSRVRRAVKVKQDMGRRPCADPSETAPDPWQTDALRHLSVAVEIRIPTAYQNGASLSPMNNPG